ncbi:MAG: hypothetical protein E7022_00135 [Desulfovibrio desulfuricans]|nr:hypothetical protein [Desulfovibrio desulfuricans]
MAADARLDSVTADRINSGSAKLGDERRLEDVLRRGEPLFAQCAPRLRSICTAYCAITSAA